MFFIIVRISQIYIFSSTYLVRINMEPLLVSLIIKSKIMQELHSCILKSLLYTKSYYY